MKKVRKSADEIRDAQIAKNRKAILWDKRIWGGFRKGAGRKPSPRPLAQLSTTIYKSDLEYLRKLAPTFRESIHELIAGRDAQASQPNH